jgi:hypothetical protein
MTALYKNLKRLRETTAGSKVAPLSPEERDIYDAGHVARLVEPHHAIGTPVLQAYGWMDAAPTLVGTPGATIPSLHKDPAQEAPEEEVLLRLVAANHARQSREAMGEINLLGAVY